MHNIDLMFGNYKQDDKVEFTLDGNLDNIMTGTIKGLSCDDNIVRTWIVEVDDYQILSNFRSSYNYSCCIVWGTYIKPLGSKEEFPFQKVLKGDQRKEHGSYRIK